MKTFSFAGGVHPKYNKGQTAGMAVTTLEAPEEVAIPLSQHIGAPAKACVEAKAEVLVGQLIGEPTGFVSAPVHSSVSGTVTAIESRPGPMGKPVECIVIANDGEYRSAEFEGLGDGWVHAPVEELKAKVSEAGIVGMGGATFPTHVKLSPPPTKPIDAVIINGAECEPYLTADHRIMVERPGDVVTGLQIAMKILGAKQGIIGIEVNKPDALEAMQNATRESDIQVYPLAVKYPQGAEKQLIDACLKREVPSGGLPMDVGVVVQNAGTAVAMFEAVLHGRPLVERVVTITGAAIKEPANLSIRIGTSVAHVLEQCGGLTEDAGKLIMGGPMMGLAQHTDDIPVTKGTSGLLCLSQSDVYTSKPGPCIKCGRCVRVCPMAIVPTEIAAYSDNQMFVEAEAADAMDCIECGSCSFSCPAHLPLVQQIRIAKAAIIAARRAQKA